MNGNIAPRAHKDATFKCLDSGSDGSQADRPSNLGVEFAEDVTLTLVITNNLVSIGSINRIDVQQRFL